MDPTVCYVVVLPNFVNDPLQGSGVSQYSGVMVNGDRVGDLAEEDDQLSPPFGEEFVSLQLGWILGKFGTGSAKAWMW